jgi:ComF family protein
MVLFRLRRSLAGWGRIGLDLLYPPRCALCRTDLPLAADHPVCPACRRRLTADRPRCLRCGTPGTTDACTTCRRFPPPCAGLVVLGPYADELRELVLRAKRPAGDLIARGLGSLLADARRTTFDDWAIDLVVPVPMHWRRRLFRGTSSADDLARGLASCLGLPCRRLLRRRRPTRMQNELPVRERRGNVAGAFRPPWLWGARRLRGRRVLLVDDVTTTGSTLAACRDAAISAGAAAVYAAVVARADRSGDADD